LKSRSQQANRGRRLETKTEKPPVLGARGEKKNDGLWKGPSNNLPLSLEIEIGRAGSKTPPPFRIAGKKGAKHIEAIIASF